MVVIFLVLTPIALVRSIEKFSFTFLIGIVMLMITLIITSVYVSGELVHEGLGPDIVAFNKNGYS
jgi:hypothetical protein